MSSEELVNAYVQGQISRRTLIRRLVAGGVSLGAAISYAHLISPGRAKAGFGEDAYHYDAQVKVVEDDLDRVIDNGKVRVKIRSPKDNEFSIEIRLLRPNHPTPSLRDCALGYRSVSFDGPDAKRFGVPLNANPPYSRLALEGRNKAKIVAIVGGDNNSGYSFFYDQATLTR